MPSRVPDMALLRRTFRLAWPTVLACALTAAAQEIDLLRISPEAGSGAPTLPAAAAGASIQGVSPTFSVPSLSAGAAFAPALSAAPRAAVSLPAAAAPMSAVPAAAIPAAAKAATPAEAAGLSAPSVQDDGPACFDPKPASPAVFAAAAPAAGRAEPGSEGSRRASRARALAAATARALFFWRATAADGTGTSATHGGQARLAASEKNDSSHAAPAVERIAPGAATPGKRPFMAGTFVYNLATSVMLVVQQALFFTLAQQDQLARGVPAGQAGLHAAGVVFALATLTGAMRIPGNSLGAWLSARTDQRNLAAISSGSRAAILAAVGALVVFHQMTLPLAAILYSADWLIGGLEEVSRNTQTLALVKSGSSEFKSWSTLSQFLAQLTGLFGPLFVIVLAQFKGLAMAGHVLAPLLFGASAALYMAIPKDAFHRASDFVPSERISRVEKWRTVLGDRKLLLPVLSLALMSVLLLKGPLSLNMASLLLGKSGSDLVTYSALLSGLFGAGLGAGSWLAHKQDGGAARRRSPAQWLALAALGTAALAGSWFFGLWPALVLPAIASAWFCFAMANAACQSLMTHSLQESVAAAGPDKQYVVGLSLTLSNVVITVLRVLAGAIFFLAAKNWQTAFGLFGALMLAVALGQWLLSRALAKGAPRAP
jgi:hypothetical protein